MNSDALSFITLTGDPQDPEFYGAVVARIHSHNSAQVGDDGRLGVHFLGAAVVRVFGTGAALQHFSNHPQMRRLLGRAHASLPAAVPAGAPLLRVSRNNAVDRDKPSYRARYKAVAQRGQDVMAQVRKSATQDTLVQLRSSTTRQAFRLLVKTTAVAPDTPRTVRFNNYGLCLEGGVPAF